MTQSSPLASPESWDLVDDGYAELVAPVLAHYPRDAITLAAWPAWTACFQAWSGDWFPHR